MGKLVRDRIPEIIRADGRVPDVRVLDGTEFAAALRTKLVEEVQEFLSAGPSDLLDEAADVFEVLLAIVGDHGYTEDHLLAAASAKRGARGGFEGRIWWNA